jgi:hypothetical protein
MIKTSSADKPRSGSHPALDMVKRSLPGADGRKVLQECCSKSMTVMQVQRFENSTYPYLLEKYFQPLCDFDQ